MLVFHCYQLKIFEKKNSEKIYYPKRIPGEDNSMKIFIKVMKAIS